MMLPPLSDPIAILPFHSDLIPLITVPMLLSPVHKIGLFWGFVSITLLGVEFFIWKKQVTQYRLIALAMAIPALALSFGFIRSWRFVPYFHQQLLYWLVLSALLVIWGRPLLLKQTDKAPKDATEATALTEIPAGQAGRVMYEGVSWQARCEDEQMAIAAHQKVCVVRREGTTLVVLPDYLLRT